MRKIISSILLLIMLGSPLWADMRDQLVKTQRKLVIRVIDGDTLVLEDQTRVRLVGIQAPKLPMSRRGFKGWPMGDKSREYLSRLVGDQYVTLYYGGARKDRYGRLLAHLFLDNGDWVQGAILESGMARVYTFPDNRAVVSDMIQREDTARQYGRGIWAQDFYRPKIQEKAAEHGNSFQLITGRVRDVAKIRGTYYLNFGDDWREDFTIVVKSRAARKFIKAEMPLENYRNKKIEVRGWLKSFNGPMIELTHPEQIRLIQ